MPAGNQALTMLSTRVGKAKFPNVLNDTSSLTTYFDLLEMIAGCIPADMLPPEWRHDSDEVETIVRKR